MAMVSLLTESLESLLKVAVLHAVAHHAAHPEATLDEIVDHTVGLAMSAHDDYQNLVRACRKQSENLNVA